MEEEHDIAAGLHRVGGVDEQAVVVAELQERIDRELLHAGHNQPRYAVDPLAEELRWIGLAAREVQLAVDALTVDSGGDQ